MIAIRLARHRSGEIPRRPRHVLAGLALTGLALTLAACGDGGPSDDMRAASGPTAWRVEPVESPAGPGSAQPGLSAGSDGVWLSWMDSGSVGKKTLWLSRWDGAQWSAPLPVVSSERLIANWADTPGVLPMADGSLVAHWLEEGSERGALEIRVSRSTDAGGSWSDPVTPHRDGTPAERGFVSLVDRGPARFGVVWLDGRRMGHAGETMLMFSEWSEGGFGPEIQLDERVCDCCRTAAVRTSEGVLVAYRDRSDEEIRDISFVREGAEGWSWPAALHDDGWRLEGCPVDGPATVVDGPRGAVVWTTEGGGDRRVVVALSDDGGSTFSPPVRLDGGRAVGRVDAVALPGGSVFACWMEQTDEPGGSVIVARAIEAGGVLQDPFRIATTSAARSAGFPRLAAASGETLVAWTETGEPPRVRVARIQEP